VEKSFVQLTPAEQSAASANGYSAHMSVIVLVTVVLLMLTHL
jgi:hypothetical protein